MAEPKTRPTKKSVPRFLRAPTDERQRRDAIALAQMMKDITKAKPEMWGSSIIGFGRYRLRYANGREAEWPLVAFSPRMRELTIYLEQGFTRERQLLRKLGKHKTSKVCLYIKSLEDVDVPTLKAFIRKSIKVTKGQARWASAA